MESWRPELVYTVERGRLGELLAGEWMDEVVSDAGSWRSQAGSEPEAQENTALIPVSGRNY